VRRLLRRGAWSAPRYGVISPLPAESGCSTEVAAAAAALAWPETVISHASAAAVHCLPLLAPAGPPTLSADCWHRACTRDDIHMRISALFGDDFDDWFGAAVTSIERTIIDLARMRGVGQGLVAADAALHERLTTPARLRQTLLRQTGWPGVRAARQAVQLADGRSESPLESLARLCLVDGGLPLPDLQVRVDTDGGPYRVDMLYRKQRVIIELDGLLKYRNDPRALVAEKRRQEHLERAGYRVIRLLWEDVLHRPAETLARVRAALAGR
jgi:very-short-patch-repair endonuclease